MKGVVFTEFLELVEQQFGLAMVDRIIEASDLPSQGAYTSVGTYDPDELLQLVTHLSRSSDVAVSTLVHAFGKHLFRSFTANYSHLSSHIRSAPEFLANVEGFIHVEVLKLYPDACLPRLTFNQLDSATWELDYESNRPFADLAAGLIEACIEHFDEPIAVHREDTGKADGKTARFLFEKQSEVVPCPISMS